MLIPSVTSGTDISYNGVMLRDCRTHQFDQTVEYDPSGTDRLFSRYTIQVESFVNGFEFNINLTGDVQSTFGADASQVNAVFNNSTAATRLRIMQELLSVPRAPFAMYHNGKFVLRVDSKPRFNSGTGVFQQMDMDNGPKPKSVQVVEVLPNKAYRILFTIEMCVLTCGGESTIAISKSEFYKNPLISNRFVIDEVRDSNFFNTRILMGRARVAHADFWSLAVRDLVTPPLAMGYQRMSAQFTVDYNGLDMTYRFVDKQKYAAPPYPATHFEGIHEESTNPSGAVSQGAIQVKVWGAPDGTKKALYLVAMSIIQSRIGLFKEMGPEQDLDVVPVSFSVTDIMNEMCISVSAQFTRAGRPKDDRTGEEDRWVNLMLDKLGLLPAVAILQILESRDPKVQLDASTLVREDGRPPNQDAWPLPLSSWDNGAPYARFAAALQDGCSAWYMARQPVDDISKDKGKEDEINEREDYPKTYNTWTTIGRGDVKSEESKGDNKINNDNQQKIPYTHIEIRSDYPQDYGFVALPKFSTSLTPADGDVVITKLRAAISRKVVFVTARRLGAQPQLPEIQPIQKDANGIIYVLDEYHPEFVAPQLMADQINFSYEQNIRLVYLMSRALKPDDVLSIGSLPWDITKRNDKTNVAKLDGSQQQPDMNPIRTGNSEDGKDESNRR